MVWPHTGPAAEAPISGCHYTPSQICGWDDPGSCSWVVQQRRALKFLHAADEGKTDNQRKPTGFAMVRLSKSAAVISFVDRAGNLLFAAEPIAARVASMGCGGEQEDSCPVDASL